VLALRKGSEQVTPPEPEPRRVVRATTAAALRAMLEGVVLGGTGKLAQLDGYTTAGKTGTAQKIDPATGRYSATQLIASFVGFAPINNPAITVLVQLDSPVGAHEGGSVAAPVFKRIAEQVLAYRNVPHDIAVPANTLHASRGARTEATQDDVADFDPVQRESLDSISGDAPDDSLAGSLNGLLKASSAGALSGPQTPPRNSAKSVSSLPSDFSAAGASAATQNVASPPTVEIAEGAGVPVPSLAGKTVREVIQICQQMGMNPVLIGSGIAEEQEPEAGASLRRGGRVTVHFGRTREVAQVHLRRGSK
jgi:cell division protein FtsI (penicillin-binding protein 3)